MSDQSFSMGETEADRPSPNITEVSQETLGPAMHISVVRPQRGVQERFSEPYLMPSVESRNGGYDTFPDPVSVIAPTSGLLPEPAIAPAAPYGEVGPGPVPGLMPFKQGIAESGGVSVPLR
jgi:hypothetical protein